MASTPPHSGDCVFCKILSGAIPSPRVFEDDQLIVIRDIAPQAPSHFLVIPKLHLESLDQAFPIESEGNVSTSHVELLGHMMKVGTQVAREQGLLPRGFRAVINTLSWGGQSVFHLHLHILGGKPLAGSFS